MSKDYFKEAVFLHDKLKGKIRISNKMSIRSKEDLSTVYSPGVAQPCIEISQQKERVWDLTMKGNSVAIISDGTAVLGLGDIGPHAAIPVMEGKAMLFRKFADIDAFPICLDTKDVDEIVRTCQIIAPIFGGINLEDISAPRSFEIEERLQSLGIPVFHDDQHGTAVVVLAGLINACKVAGKKMSELKVVINGAGAAGVAIAKLISGLNCHEKTNYDLVQHIIICDSKGIIGPKRTDLNDSKRELLEFTNPESVDGRLIDALSEADVFVGVSIANIMDHQHLQQMKKDPIVFALANPIPEISPEEANKGNALIYATGRSDFPNQINNVLGFPGIFRGALDARAKKITTEMKMAAAVAIAHCVEHPSKGHIIPSSLNEQVAWNVAKAVRNAATK